VAAAHIPTVAAASAAVAQAILAEAAVEAAGAEARADEKTIIIGKRKLCDWKTTQCRLFTNILTRGFA
jgi:hypothetical protein